MGSSLLHATTVNIDDEINSEQAMISIRSSSDGRCISTTTINKLDKQLNRLVKKKRLLEEEAEFVLVNRPDNNLESPNEKEQKEKEKEKDEDEDKPVQQASLNQNAVSNLNSSESEPPINTDLSNQQSISKASQSWTEWALSYIPNFSKQ